MLIKYYLVLLTLFTLSACKNSDADLVNGMPLPDFSIPEIETHKTIHKTDLKGNIVLVDFWASWCAPCRKVHPKILKIKQKYERAQFQQAEQFIVLSISLDTDSSAWQKAIQSDKIGKDFLHASELNGWQSETAQKLKINAIPASYLIDENGLIIGKNLAWRDLDLILSKRLAVPL